MKRRLQIALDADGVLRDFTSGAIAVVREITGKVFTPVDVTAFNFAEALGLSKRETDAVMSAISQREGFVRALPSYPKARQGVQRLRDLGEVFCVTTPWESPWGTNPWWRAESEAWLALHIGIDVVHHAEDKSNYDAAVFVDDRAKNVAAWLAKHPGRVGVLWRTPHNTGEAVPVHAHSTSAWETLFRVAQEHAMERAS